MGDENHKTFLQRKIEDFAIWQDFVTEFTSLVVVQSDQPRSRRGIQKHHMPMRDMNVQIRKKRSPEKQEKINHYLKQAKEMKEHTHDLHFVNQMVDQSDELPKTAETSDEKPRLESLDSFEYSKMDEENMSTRKRLMYILISIVGFKFITSRRKR